MNLLDYLPRQYYGSPEIEAIERALGAQADALWAARNSFFDQLDLESATWGLTAWETTFGLTPKSGQSLSERRQAVKAKLRGRGIATVEVIRNIAAAFSEGPVIVREFFAEYRFEVEIRLAAGGRDGLGALRQRIEEAKPAHLLGAYASSTALAGDTVAFAPVLGRGYMSTSLPEAPFSRKLDGVLRAGGCLGTITATVLPEAE